MSTRYGRKQISNKAALDEIHALLDGTEWSNEMLETIADILLTCGRPVRDCNHAMDPEGFWTSVAGQGGAS